MATARIVGEGRKLITTKRQEIRDAEALAPAG